MDPRVFLNARKPPKWNPKNLTDIALYSIELGKRTLGIIDFKDVILTRRLANMILSSKIKWLLPSVSIKILGKSSN
ncbi:MAG: hypothetical protein QXM93_06055 [Candidatus Methanomethyliaceae archaeon]